MYEETNTTFEDVTESPHSGLKWNGEKYAYHTESPDEKPDLNDNEIALTPWDTDWDNWSPADTNVLVLTKNEITNRLQSPDQPLNTWR